MADEFWKEHWTEWPTVNMGNPPACFLCNGDPMDYPTLFEAWIPKPQMAMGFNLPRQFLICGGCANKLGWHKHNWQASGSVYGLMERCDGCGEEHPHPDRHGEPSDLELYERGRLGGCSHWVMHYIDKYFLCEDCGFTMSPAELQSHRLYSPSEYRRR